MAQKFIDVAIDAQYQKLSLFNREMWLGNGSVNDTGY